ncbi:MAG: 5'-nucleotidase, lipoprotein e(P4) family [Bacteroidales bacterium]|nr:5'-nucleotidase, lipoprotein e(P4) family [Bacteroidales bacterium]
MGRVIIYSFLISLIIATGCNSDIQKSSDQNNTNESKTKSDSILAKQNISYNPLMQAVVYQQLSAEKYALEYQTYQLAKMALKEDLANKSIDTQRAVILDIDETVLDNSPYEVMLVRMDTSYPAGWAQWINQSNAELIAGVKDFLVFAKNYGVDIFYLTNRKEQFRNATLKNLNKYDLPQADNDHLLMRTNTSSKKARRDRIKTDYHISLLIGDNLNDFLHIFENKSNEEKKELVDQHQELFGKRFIVLPNATYGDWEAATFQYDYSLNKKEKYIKMLEQLEGF